MYSMVLMAALTTGQATPDCWCKCAGACYGYGCYGCYGGCYGCWGYGGHGWAGGYGCYGCNGCFGCHGCYGCYGCFGCYGGGAPSYILPGGPAAEPAPPPKEEKKGMAPTKAKLIVSLPADAKLYIDDQLMKTTSERRVFNTPTLDRDQTYYYILRAEVEVDGKKLTDTKRVLVRAGEEIRANFAELEAKVNAAREAASASARR
jgi:uncharacterized protein (TIGR03000 family)